MSLKDDINAEAKKYGGGGSNSDFFQFEKGVNRMRILVQPKVIAFHFFGKGEKPAVCVGIEEGCIYHKEGDKKASIKLATYILDRKDGKVKLAELPLSISYSLNDLQEDSDFAFEDFPMPFDIKITSDPDNADPKAKYRLQPSPTKEPLTDEEETALSEALKKMTPEQYVEMKKKFQSGSKEVSQLKSEDVDYGSSDAINPDDVPF